MKNYKISHEAPISILDEIQKKTDYDYCLLHMLLQDSEYRDWFIHKVRKEHLILDNSAYELGSGLTGDKIVEGFNLIKPEYVVAPDVIKDATTTNKNFLDFKEKYGDQVEKIGGVVQASNFEEFEKSLQFMFEHADLVMIPVGIFKKGIIRFSTIQLCVDRGSWSFDKPVHLLGCKDLTELYAYQYNPIENIVSIDTSSPVQYVLENNEVYPIDITQYKKPTKMVDYKEVVSEKQLNKIYDNIRFFKTMLQPLW